MSKNVISSTAKQLPSYTPEERENYSKQAAADVMRTLSDCLDGDASNRLSADTQREYEARLQSYFKSQVYY